MKIIRQREVADVIYSPDVVHEDGICRRGLSGPAAGNVEEQEHNSFLCAVPSSV